MNEALILGGFGALFFLALCRIWGWEMMVDIFLSPVRRYDFDEESVEEETDGGKG